MQKPPAVVPLGNGPCTLRDTPAESGPGPA
jgi:hypothetical protein